MRNKSVAVLDIRSYEVTFLIGAKGINNTFIFRGGKSEKYEGFSVDGFYDTRSFRGAVISAVSSVRQNYEGVLKEIYVGVPSAFVSVCTKGHTVSFSSKRTISGQEIEMLYDSGLNELSHSGRCIRRSAMYFSSGDNRRYFRAEDICGLPASSLRGALCYYFISEDFYDAVSSALSETGFEKIHFIPSTLAQAEYLMPPKTREGYTFLLDVGYLTSSVSVVYGDGIVHEETFDFGTGCLLAALVDGLKVELPTAEAILASSDISGGMISKDEVWSDGELSFRVLKINEIIKFSLDGLCEKIAAFFYKYYEGKSDVLFVSEPLFITGEGVNAVRGLPQHISERLNRLMPVVCPDLPYYGKPEFSSRISLLSKGIEDSENTFLNGILRFFGKKGR